MNHSRASWRSRLSALVGTATITISPVAAADTAWHYGRRIVPPAEPSATVQAAVADLRDYLGRMTGAEFTTGEAGAGAALVLARAADPDVPAAAAAALRDRSTQAFCVWPEGDRLWLVSASDSGLSHAAACYLERLGVRWYAPTERWTIVPRRDDLRIDRPIVESPAFTCRGFFGTGGFGGSLPCDPQRSLQAAWTTWQRRNRFGGELTFGGHTGEAFNTKHKSLLEEHPEYRAEVNGSRVPWSLIAKPCFSNSEVMRLYVEDRVAALRMNQKRDPAGPGSRIVSVEPADGGGHCDCAECRKLGSVSDRVFHVANVVARAIRAVQPDGLVSLLAYNQHAAVPTIDLEPNVFVLAIPYGFQRTVLTPEQLLSAWGRKTARLGVYDYWSIPDWALDTPSFDFLDRGPKKLRFWQAAGATAFLNESTYSTGGMGPAWYVAARLAWDPNRDARGLFAEYCRDCFGPAAEPMQRMLERWTKGYFATSHELALSFRDVEEAWGLVGDRPECERRVADMGRYVEYLRLRFEFEQAAPKSEAKREAATDLMDHCWKIYDSSMVHAFRLWQLLVSREKDRIPELAGRYDMKDKTRPGWQALEPLTDTDVRRLVAEGVRSYEPQSFAPRRYDGRPQPPPGGVAASAEEFSPAFFPMNSQTLVIAAEKGRTLRLRSAAEHDLGVTVTDADGEVTFQRRLAGDPRWLDEWQELVIPFAADDVYRLVIRSPKKRFRFSFGTELPVSLDGWTNSPGRPTPRLFFFVPRDIDRVAIYASYTASGPPRFFDPTNAEIEPAVIDGGKLMLFDVPPEHRGAIWSLDKAKCPNEPLRMLNVPGLVAFERQSLLVPSDALNPSGQRAGE